MPKGVPNPENRCTATNRQGERCGRPVVKGRTTCRFHGGLTPRGTEAIEAFKTGKYSKYLPKNLKERYEYFLNDPDRDTSGNDIALLDVRLSQLAENIETDVSSEVWEKMFKMWGELMYAIRSGDAIKQAEAINKIDDFISDTDKHEKRWKDIERIAEVRRKLADSEQRRHEKAKQMITVEQAMILVQGLINSLREVVFLYADNETAGYIIDGASQAYTELVGGPPDSTIDTRAITRNP